MKKQMAIKAGVSALILILMASLPLFGQDCCKFPYLTWSNDSIYLIIPAELQEGVLELYNQAEQLECQWFAPDGTALYCEEAEPSKRYTLEWMNASGGDRQEYALMAPSESSGEIRIYFNYPGFLEIAPDVQADGSSGLELRDAIVEFIEMAQQTIDIAMYNNNRAEIVEALKRAVNRGVRVRYITDDERSNIALDNDINFPVWKDFGSEGLMHNKFLVIDAALSGRAWVIGGSTNFTTGQIATDPNNLIALQDQSVARIYTVEFEEMWGGDGLQPDGSASRFGEFKSDNTAHYLSIGEIPFELFFSPSDRTEKNIVDALHTADHNIYAALLIFTSNPLGDALETLHFGGIDVTVMIEDAFQGGSEYFSLQSAGVSVHDFEDSGILHHKYAIVDHDDPESDPLVINGSHNWTWSAENINDENTMIIHDYNIARIYAQDFWALACDQEIFTCSTANSDPKELSEKVVRLKENPVQDRIRLEVLRPAKKVRMLISDVSGRLVYSLFRPAVTEGVLVIPASHLPPGIYYLRWADDQAIETISFFR